MNKPILISEFIRMIRMSKFGWAHWDIPSRRRGLRYSDAGFTLIELLLYMGIVGAIIFSIAGFLSLSIQSRVKNQTIAEVEQQGIQVMQVITQTGRNSTDINFTTAFDLSGGIIRENTIALTNSRVVASGLTFQNLSRAGTTGTVRIQFTLTHANPEGRNEYDYSKTFYGTATLR